MPGCLLHACLRTHDRTDATLWSLDTQPTNRPIDRSTVCWRWLRLGGWTVYRSASLTHVVGYSVTFGVQRQQLVYTTLQARPRSNEPTPSAGIDGTFSHRQAGISPKPHIHPLSTPFQPSEQASAPSPGPGDGGDGGKVESYEAEFFEERESVVASTFFFRCHETAGYLVRACIASISI